MLARLFCLYWKTIHLSGASYPAPVFMNLESLKVGFRDLVAIGGLISTILISYFSLRGEIRDVAKTLDGDRKLYELRLELLETKVDKMQMDIERLKYDNTDKNGNYPSPANKRR